MELKDLLKRIIDTCNYNEMQIDTEMTIEYLCMITEPLATKNVNVIHELIVTELMERYRQTDDIDEIEYIQDTMCMLLKYLGK